MFLLGSQGRGNPTGLSDIDIVFETSSAAEDIVAGFQAILPVIHHQVWSDGKVVFWIGEICLKIDCWVVQDAASTSKYYWSSRLLDDNSWILLDRVGDLADRLQVTQPLKMPYEDPMWLNQRIVNQLEAASKHHARSDTFRYMFAMQIAYDSLIRLACHVAEDTDSIYLPKAGHRILEGVLPRWTSPYFGVTGNLRVANERKHNLFECWKELTAIAREKGFELGDHRAEEDFLERVLKRDHIWNLRDISDGILTQVLRGKVYRGACLVPHLSEPELNAFLRDSGIVWLVDLRSDAEWNDRPYPDDFPVQVVRCPTWNRVERPLGWPARNSQHSVDYVGNLADMANHVPNILSLISSGEPGYIHCHAGRDRTGVICALILRLLGCSMDDLECSYSLSSDADMEEIRVLTSWFNDESAFNQMLMDIGVGESLMKGVRAALLSSQSQEVLH